MEVKDIFELRKQGKKAEAYKLISEKYAAHQGHYTTMCMFWCTDDMLRLAIGSGDLDRAKRLLFDMTRLYPPVDGIDERAASCIAREAVEMDRHIDDFNLIYFLPYFQRLAPADWLATTIDGHRVPSLGQQVVNHLLKGLERRDADYISAVTPLFQKAVAAAPRYKENLRHMAQMKALLGQKDEARQIYRSLLSRYHDPYLYAELARLVDDEAGQIALLAQAVTNQRTAKFSVGYHLQLARLLARRVPSRALYELNRYSELMKDGRSHEPAEATRLRRSLEGVKPVSADDERAFYQRARSHAEKIIRG